MKIYNLYIYVKQFCGILKIYIKRGGDILGNIIDYVKTYGKFTFSEMPFSDVDSLILSQLSYMNFFGCEVAKGKFIAKISDLALIDEAVLTENTPEPEKNKELLYECAKSARFKNLGVSFFVNETDEKSEKQFSAVTFKLSDKLFYIAYRGTDTTLVGWKEDFNLACLKKVPAQNSALAYLKKVAKKTKGTLILGGHSKGGNLAVFSAFYAPVFLKHRIKAVFDHDGPGFLEEFFSAKKMSRLAHKLHKTVPQSAFVGLLLGNLSEFTVVESKAFGLFQHDPFSWQVEENHFKICKFTDKISKHTADKINNWLKNTDVEKRKLFVDSLYCALKKTGAKTYFELLENKNANLKKIFSALKDTDPEVKNIIKSMIRNLLKTNIKGKMKLPKNNL